MAELLILRGAMASGKTTFSNEWVAADSEHRARVNRDDIRSMVGITGGIGSNEQEQLVSKIEKASVITYLDAGVSVVLDATNMHARNNKAWMQLALEHGATYDFKTFNVDERTAIARDKVRGAMGGRMVGEDVIKVFFAKWVHPVTGNLPSPPTLDGPHSVQFKPYVPGEQPAFSFDLDGTLAHHVDRSPYDFTKYHTDEVDEALRDLTMTLGNIGYPVIILTGRGEEYRAECEAWLAANYVYHTDMFMRPAGDMRRDDIIKSEMVDKYISNVYDIRIHFDDRNRVVDALRIKGMKVAQVAYGEF